MNDEAETRYPNPNTEIKAVIYGYPIVVAASYFAQARSELWWEILIFCGIGWFVVAAGAVINLFRREGYRAALQDKIKL